MIQFHFADLAKAILVFLLAACQSSPKAVAAHAAMVNRGDEINGMTLTNGAAGAPPLWAFCTSEVSNNIATANCRVPQMQKLGVGYVFLDMKEIFPETKWSELIWNFFIDDQLVNLADFGTYNYVLPTLAPHPSPVREVFIQYTAWDVVLTNLQPGAHTIEGQVRTNTEQYKWIVNLTIKEKQVSKLKVSTHQLTE